jgi:hypothetical protein
VKFGETASEKVGVYQLAVCLRVVVVSSSAHSGLSTVSLFLMRILLYKFSGIFWDISSSSNIVFLLSYQLNLDRLLLKYLEI